MGGASLAAFVMHSDRRYDDGTTRSAFAAVIRRAHANGATPSQLLLMICEREGKACHRLEFEIIAIVRAAFLLSLGLCRLALDSPWGRHRMIESEEEYDKTMRLRMDENRHVWGSLLCEAS